MAYDPRIKFCGITRLADAERAAELGAWAVGVILWPGSPRHCRQTEAATIGAALHRRTEVAGVFVNAHLDHVAAAAEAIGLTLLQLHGDEGPAYCAEAARRTGCKIVKVARVHGRADIRELRTFHTDFHLLDAYVPDQPGGTGETFAWDLVGEHPRDRPLVLSGGLTPENVGDAIAAVHPFAVDVSSGVERAPGVKDHGRMAAFAAAVAAAAAALQPVRQPTEPELPPAAPGDAPAALDLPPTAPGHATAAPAIAIAPEHAA